MDFNEDIPNLTLDNAELVSCANRQARFKFDRRKTSASELIVSLAAKYSVKDIGVEEPEIEAIVREIYQNPGFQFPEKAAE